MPVVRFVDFSPVEEGRRIASLRQRESPLVTWVEPGVGLRFGYRLTDHVAIEAEGVAYGRYSEEPVRVRGRRGVVETGLYKLELLLGPVVRTRFGRVAILGKARAGFVRFWGFPAIVAVERAGPLELTLSEFTAMRFAALDLGGGAEMGLARRLLVRVDAGDMIVWYRPRPHDLNPSYLAA